MTPLHRRDFLQRSAALAALASGRAAAAPGDDYKALVCVFLYGGNDAYNTVLATDRDSWALYRAAREQSPEPLALPAAGAPAQPWAPVYAAARHGGVLPIEPRHDQGRRYALHPVLTGVRDLFAAGRLAVVCNVGPLVEPLAKADWADPRVPRPAGLFSHNDQQSTWQALGVEGARAGWGGRLAERLAQTGADRTFVCVSAQGNALWPAGDKLEPYRISPRGAIEIVDNAAALFGSEAAAATLRRVMRTARTSDLLARDHAAVAARSIEAQARLRSALPPADSAPYGSRADADPLLHYTSPAWGIAQPNPLAAQLQIVARLIGARAALGQRRQVFFVGLNGFDTHDRQNRDHAELLAQLDHGLRYFDGVLAALGLQEQVTTFTMSDFGRGFASNGDGTDHGWGAHHFVMGGAVRGRDLYGRFPAYGAADGHGGYASPDQLGNGALLPGVSLDQYGATLARWFGVPDAGVLEVFPNLARRPAAQRFLRFMA